ncbi:MAG TPA: acetate--CoA ligase family protein [Sandaracinaceae bacterium]
MSRPWRIYCDDAELAVECARAAAPLSLAVEPQIADDAMERARAAIDRTGHVAVAVARPPSPAALTRLAAQSRAHGALVPIAIVAPREAREKARLIAGDLGLVAVSEIRPLASAMALAGVPGAHPWTASARGLTAIDRIRLGEGTLTPGRSGGRLIRVDDGRLAWLGRGEPIVVGEPGDVGEALRALRTRSEASPPARAVIDGVDRAAVQQVIFGPPRALSDPASKAALEPYGLPLPVEELCTSPSRAAAEAARIGFPVRISLASPDLRIWDHPDLAFDGVDNAARVRDVYRQMIAMASERQPDARLLGVVVAATTTAQALLRVVVEPLPEGSALAEIGFADPHGRASGDRTYTVLPATHEAIERVLARLAGSELVLGGGAAQRRASVGAIADALLRLAAFVDDHAREVERVELHPLALLANGTVEVREACVTVGDAFLRSLEHDGSEARTA